MEPKRYQVHFLPDDIKVEAEEGENLLKLAMANDVHIDANCGGARVCGKCRVKLEGEYEKIPPRKNPGELPPDTYLACCTNVMGDLTVTVPEATRVTGTLPTRSKGTGRSKLTGIDIQAIIDECGVQPVLDKVRVVVPEATMDVNSPDLDRLLAALRAATKLEKVGIEYAVLKELPEILREKGGEVTATIRTPQVETNLFGPCIPTVIRLEAGDTSDKLYAVAYDIGTTSVWASMIDLRSGEVLADAADYNAQSRFGADVINRILACKKAGIGKVQGAVVETMNTLLAQMSEKSGVDAEEIAYFVAAGNTTMTHIMLGMEPKYIQLAPHTPVARFAPPIPAISIGMKASPHAELFTVPSVSAWVGGDIVAGTLISGFSKQEKLTLFIDLGTNGEIVLGNQDFLLSASCSAGPAFEGGEIRHGMRAMDGAIEDFHLNGADAEPMILTINQQPAKGICGSGLINIVAGLFLAGVLQPNGKYSTDLKIPRLREGDEGLEYVLVWAKDADGEQDITLTEVDLDNLMRAKSAVYSGIRVLLSDAGMEPSMLEQVIIAGSFGQSLDIERAVIIGLLPDLPIERFTFIGNGSLMGARLALQCGKGMAEGDDIASQMTYIDLGADSRFMDEYMAGMFLPHTDDLLFPSVKQLIQSQK